MDPEMLRAIQMSLEGKTEEEGGRASGQEELARMAEETLSSPEFMDSVIASLPGVNAEDPALKGLLKKEDKKEDDDEKDGK
mmetsp:Transcript_20630/g.53053  ORF Transcript_20630/g.53053 Transcript_20630/m.53053 type:complete len:81 (+) Transcript_20630:406-648(+)